MLKFAPCSTVAVVLRSSRGPPAHMGSHYFGWFSPSRLDFNGWGQNFAKSNVMRRIDDLLKETQAWQAWNVWPVGDGLTLSPWWPGQEGFVPPSTLM